MNILARLFGKAGVPLYHLIEPRVSEVLGPWAVHFPAYAEVVGYSALGHFFLRNPSANEYAVLHPYKKAAKSYGSFASLAEFEQNLLRIPLHGGHDSTLMAGAVPFDRGQHSSRSRAAFHAMAGTIPL